MTTVRFIILHLLLATAASTALAQPAPPPPLVNQEGVILDRFGFPLDEVDVQLTFRLFGAQEGGAPLWQEAHDVFVRGGYYNVVLGSASDSSLLDVVLESGELWLQISIEDETLLPRQPVVSTPFAMLAADAAALSCSGCVTPDNLSLTYARPQDISWPNLAGIPPKLEDLGALACAVGEVPSWNGVTWVCITPPGGDTLALLSCAAGEVAKSDGIDWGCATDNDANTDTLAILGCLPNQVPQWDGALWQCANTGGVDTLSGLACAPNDVAKWTGAAWVCDVDVDTDTDTQHPLPNCLPGEKVTANGSVLSCTADIDTDTDTQHPLPSCLPGEKVTANGAVLSCAADIDTDTDTQHPLPSCLPGEKVTANGAVLSCAADIDTDTTDTAWTSLMGVPAGFADGADDDLLGTLVSCAAGEVAKWNGGAWACAPDTGTGMDTLASLSCGLNQVAKWNGGAWACAVDVDTDTTDTAWGSLTGVPGGFADGVDDVGSVTVPNCTPSEKLTGDGANLSCAADIDTDTTDTAWGSLTGVPAGLNDGDDNTQLAVPLCLASQKLTGNGAILSCAPDVTDTLWGSLSGVPAGLNDGDDNTTYTGADFALSNQMCPPGQFIDSIDSVGIPTCSPDVDTNTTYSGADFALSGQDCGAGSYYQGVSAAGMPICAVDAGTAYSEGSGLDLTGTVFSVEPAGIVNSMMAMNSVGTSEIIDFSINDMDINLLAAINPSKIAGTAWTSTNDGAGTGLDADTVDGFEGDQFWQRAGNAGTFPSNDFVGTSDNVALNVRVNGVRALLFEPTVGAANLIGGDESNTVNANVVGAVIAGGGDFTAGANTVTDDFGVVGGGAGNFAGDSNPTTTDATYAVVGGGRNNFAGASQTTIAGGDGNTISDEFGVIGGGSGNLAGDDTPPTDNQPYATVGGGRGNVAGFQHSTVGGGMMNTAGAPDTTVSGGNTNNAGVAASTIGGGLMNITDGFAATIGGGDNGMALADHATIGGGKSQTASGIGSTASGGDMNNAGGDHSTVGGGQGNGAAGPHSTIAGGQGNTAGGQRAFVAGGGGNRADGVGSFVAGTNAIASAANGDGCFMWADSTGAPLGCPSRDMTIMRSAGGFIFYTNGGASTGVTLDAGTGSWSSLSDRDSKRDVEPVDARRIARAVAALPVSAWTYKGDDARTRHIGPMAQDFNGAFDLGRDERYINSSDADGVALAAIKGLALENDTRADEVHNLRTQVQMLEARLSAIEGGELEAKGAGVLGQPSWLLLVGFGAVLALGRRRHTL